MASLLCEGDLTQEENKGTSHIPAIPAPWNTAQHEGTSKQQGQAPCFAISFLELLGNVRRFEMFKGVWFLISVLKWMKMRGHSKSLRSQECSSYGCFCFIQLWAHGCPGHAQQLSSSRCLNMHSTMLLLCLPLRELQQRKRVSLIFFSWATTDVQ